MTVDFGVNYLAVIVAAIVAVIIGVVYYGPPAIASAVARAIGWTRATAARPAPAQMATGVVVALVNAWVLAVLALNLGGSSITDGIVLGILMWLGFIATVTAALVAFEGRSWSWWTVENIHHVIVQAVIGAIVTAWR